MIEQIDKDQFISRMEIAEIEGQYAENAVKRFWDWMFKQTDGIVQACAFAVPTGDGNIEDKADNKWVHARAYSEFEDFCNTHSGLWRYHVYAGVNTLDRTPGHGRGSVRHIDRVNRISFDIETEREPHSGASKEEVWWCYRYALAQTKFMAEQYGVWPMMIMSENGVHLHYKADFECSDELLHGKQHVYTKYLTHRAINSKYANIIENKAPDSISFDQDDVSDPARVMKVPGTRGIKSENGRLCGIIHQPNLSDAGIVNGDSIDVDVDELKETFADSDSNGDTTRVVDTSPGKLNSDTMGKVKRLCKNDKRFRMYWRGDPGEYESRSEAEYAFILKMLNHGFSERQIVNVMWASGMSKWQEDSDHYRDRTIRHALEYFDGTVVKDSKDGSFNFS